MTQAREECPLLRAKTSNAPTSNAPTSNAPTSNAQTKQPPPTADDNAVTTEVVLTRAA